MIETLENTTITSKKAVFLKEVLTGLNSVPKTLPSKYFYDKIGDALFQQIMELDEYYLTQAEFEIFDQQKKQILQEFSPNGESFNLVEFGAGDGYKTKVLLKYFLSQKVDFEYIPIDISQNALDGLKKTLNQEIPDLNITPMQGDYFQVLDRLSHATSKKNIILFLGSNIGNFSPTESTKFLSQIRADINMGDHLMIGIDLKKDPAKILAAYNDQDGITAEFNLNLLHRINKELDANFNPEQFKHYPFYNPITGECKSSLISLQDQEVKIGNSTIHLSQWEPIHTEVSRKFSLKEIHDLAARCGFCITSDLSDRHGYFVDSIWKAV
ncbi:L-histidine N(alpha)-methyltransferase [Reichenbachiella agarivorans]|uniref:L-histidine N(Alpha)-methyltransferase n=1 Tax=Reichenbachiella agarivorans TaxID=2979464 RepID=A0ABY6CRU4_9BACT|nr:L-histidine N(alpha)-methyltransferase [Reichenbachiella agarivorans]UXP32564.1 L-histidine N(alpha)-methyltransferase [Reichenbachiella agarivorans]